MLARAAETGLRVGSAPDTVLGTGIQTARAVLDSGRIGSPVGAAVHWTAPGHELWHPSPAFYYQPGGGPLFDMGPYYLTSLVTLFGAVRRVSGAVSRSTRERTIATGPHAGAIVPVDVDTHVTALLEHDNGATSTLTVSFEVWATRMPFFEVYGTAGTIAMPDPNQFSDRCRSPPPMTREWVEVPAEAGYLDAGRGFGLADMARAIETDRPHRASGELAFHVLEIMESIITAGREHRVIELTSRSPDRRADQARELARRNRPHGIPVGARRVRCRLRHGPGAAVPALALVGARSGVGRLDDVEPHASRGALADSRSPHPDVQRVIANGVTWAAPATRRTRRSPAIGPRFFVQPLAAASHDRIRTPADGRSAARHRRRASGPWSRAGCRRWIASDQIDTVGLVDLDLDAARTAATGLPVARASPS